MLALVLGRVPFDKPHVRPRLVAVVPEVDELADLILRMRFMRREHGNNRVHAHTVKRFRVARDNTLKRVVLHNAFFESPLYL